VRERERWNGKGGGGGRGGGRWMKVGRFESLNSHKREGERKEE